MTNTLISLDSKGKIRIVKIWYAWDNDECGYVIHRLTGQIGGKETVQPRIVITKGKAKRTVTEQCILEYNSHIKKYLDKGYKEIPEHLTINDIDKLKEFLGENKTGQNGIPKPMGAKRADDVANRVFDKKYLASRKINGLRCLIYYKDNEIKTASRGSINYDLAIYHIISHPKLKEFFNNHPDVILDGEIYKFGDTLNYISGKCRMQSTVQETERFEFYWYDIVDTEKTFNERFDLMHEYAEELELSEFNPIREWDEGELKVQFVPHVEITGWSSIKALHDKYVKEGWEGLVIRNVDEVYGPGKKSNAMLKIKNYLDSEYKIVGLSEGLRDEDMCFVMETEDGQQFKAKPIGDRAQKQWYRDNLDDIIGKMGTLKYFEMSGKEGSQIPQQPIFICIREDL